MKRLVAQAFQPVQLPLSEQNKKMLVRASRPPVVRETHPTQKF
jgi:hypothetical protein